MEAANPDQLDDASPTLRFRAIFISDIHLGTTSCQAERLLDFLRHTDSQDLYLVGDIKPVEEKDPMLFKVLCLDKNSGKVL